MKVIHVIQGSPEWLQERAGHPTASRSGDIMAMLKSGKGEKSERANYRTEIVTERLTGLAIDHYVSADMERGKLFESDARIAYEIAKECEVDSIGIAIHPTIEEFLGSPDGIVGQYGAIEIKCPRPTTHIRWALAGCVPEEHIWQCNAIIDCCEREWIDFCSYCPDMPKHMQLFVVRLHRDEAKIEELRAGVHRFLDEVQSTISELEKRFGKATLKQALKASLDMEGGISDADIEWARKNITGL